MSGSRWEHKRVLGLSALLTACCLAEWFICRSADDAGRSDAQDLLLNAGGLLLVVVAALIAAGLARLARRPIIRLSMQIVSAGFMIGTLAVAKSSYPDISVDLASIITPAHAKEASTSIEVGPTGVDIRLSGQIYDGAAELLADTLDTHPGITRIHLTSEGGSAEEGDALAKVIAARGLATYVPDFCVSACTLAFVAGKERFVMKGARLGFHAPYEEGLFGQSFVGDAHEQRAVYLMAGVDRAFVDHALSVTPDDMWFPEPARLLSAHVVTAYVDRYAFPDSILDGIDDAAGAKVAVQRSFPALQPIEAKSPAALDRISAWYLAAYRRGASEGESVDGVKAIVGEVLTLALTRADDATLLDFGRFMLDALDAAASWPETCVAIGEHADLVAAEGLLVKHDPSADGTATALIARALASHRGAPAVPVEPSFTVGGSVTQRCGEIRSGFADALSRRDAGAIRGKLTIELRRSAKVVATLVTEHH